MPKQTIKINGPVNVVRMEGTINNIHKVIYIFMDEHADLPDQTNCDDPKKSIYVSDFFRKSFNNLKNQNKTYDFFLETSTDILAYEPNELIYSTVPNSERIYIENLWKFFYEHVKFNKETNTLSSLFKNVRLHYIDIRHILYLFLVDPLQFAREQLHENHDLVLEMTETSLNVILEFMKYIENILRINKSDKIKKNK
jgi:hypothetical protein